MIKPQTTWTGFLMSAPYVTGAIMDAMRADDLPRYPDLVRAVIYWDIFDGEVSNGGVMQYFFNQAFYLPDFEKAARIVERHPVLADGAMFMHEVFAAWDTVKETVADARSTDDWPEALFADDRFADLEDRFFKANHNIRLTLYAAICAAPDDYLSIIPEPRDDTYRFKDGFPIGPNVIETDRETRIVWFTDDRMHVEIDRSGFLSDGGRDRSWVDFRTGASGSRRFENGQLTTHQTQQSLWHRHGLYETFGDDGRADYTALSLNGEELMARLGDGKILVRQSVLDALLKDADDFGY